MSRDTPVRIARVLQKALALCQSRPEGLSWMEFATDCCGFPPTQGGRRKAFELLVRGIEGIDYVEIEYDWFGIASIHLTNSTSLDGLMSVPEGIAEGQERTYILKIIGNVGNLNTGTVHGNMESSFDVVAQSASAETAATVKELFEAVSQSTLGESTKAQVLEQLGFIAQQAGRPAEKRDQGAVKSAMKILHDALTVSGSLASLWSALGPRLMSYFGVSV